MAPVKFEEQIKQKLEQRRIQPNEEAWDKLNGRLDGLDTYKKKGGFWWLGIAAGFIGFLLVLTIVFTNSDAEAIDPIIVDTEDAFEETNPPAVLSLPVEKSQTETIKNNLTKKSTDTNTIPTNVGSVLNTKNIKEQKKLIPVRGDEAVAIQLSSDETSGVPSVNETEKIVAFEEQKIQDVVAQIKILENENKTVTDEEINILLNGAEKEIQMKKSNVGSTNTVDAMALLQDVETDLDQTFRERVFKALRSGYENVKTAVAERNN